MPTRYTSRAEMERLYSPRGLEYRAGTGFDCQTTLNWYIDDASATIDAYAGQIYAKADLATSTWIRVRATWIACYRLSQIEGNASQFIGRYDEAMDELRQVKDGLLPVPDLSTSIDVVPSMSNIDHDPRHRYATLRVQPETSTAVNGSRQFLTANWLPEWMW